MLKKTFLLASVSALAFSCVPDIDTLIPDDENSETVDSTDSTIIDTDGIIINMEWETQQNFFELFVDLVVEDYEYNEEITTSERLDNSESIDLPSREPEGIYLIRIQGRDFESFDASNDITEEVTFTITGINGVEELVYTVNVDELEMFELVTVIELVKTGDSFTFRQVQDSI